MDAKRVITIQADMEDGLSPDSQLKGLQSAIADTDLDPQVTINFKGEDEDQREAMNFLLSAFIGAVLIMSLVLETQFNSIYQVLLVLAAIVFSTAGVLLGILVTGRPFGVVMMGHHGAQPPFTKESGSSRDGTLQYLTQK